MPAPTPPHANLRPWFWTLVALLCVYELVTVTRVNHTDSITDIVRELTFSRPIVPFVAGLLAGHFFWP